MSTMIVCKYDNQVVYKLSIIEFYRQNIYISFIHLINSVFIGTDNADALGYERVSLFMLTRYDEFGL
ncbi:hypothetical protein GCM10028809_05770 [Spirosoma gilvum]